MDVEIQERITGDGALKEYPGQYGLEGYKNICFHSLPDNIAYRTPGSQSLLH